MQTYRATLRPKSATRSPWQADTLFGHLCWIIRYDEGEAALNEFLHHYRQGQPPLLFSNGFPGDLLPRPLVPAPTAAEERGKEAQVKAMRQAKAGKGIRWVSLYEFNAFRRGERVPLGSRPELAHSRTILKNQINRLTGGTTPIDEDEGGNLYSADELAFVDKSGVSPVGVDVSIYVKAKDEAWADRAYQLLQKLSQSGYGAKKSAGYGYFELTDADWQPFAGFDVALPDANGFISLSNWVPAQDDPTDGFYATMVKYGKLGEEFANSDNPFKFPLIMLTAGSSFYAAGTIRDWYGRLVAGIAPIDKDKPMEERIVQYGYAFAVPAVLRDDR